MSTNNEKYLVKRGKNKDIYFIQKRLTKEQSEVFGKNFIKKSLETTDLTQAIIKRDQILAEIDEIKPKKALNIVNDKVNTNEFINSSYEENHQNNKHSIAEKEVIEDYSKTDNKEGNMIEINVPMSTKNEDSSNEYKENEKYTIFSLNIPKFPEKDDLVIKIDKIVPIAIVIITLFIAFIA